MYVAGGNECVSHGPNRAGYLNGSLFDAWPTNEERVNDILGVIEYLSDRGLVTENGKKLHLKAFLKALAGEVNTIGVEITLIVYDVGQPNKVSIEAKTLVKIKAVG
jgi:hypothetical protein